MWCNNDSSPSSGTIFFNVVLNISRRNSSRLGETTFFIWYNDISTSTVQLRGTSPQRNSPLLCGTTITLHRLAVQSSSTWCNYISLRSGGTTRVNPHYLSRKKTILTVRSRSRNGAQKTTILYMNLLHRRSRRITGPRRSTSSQKYSKSNGNGDIRLYIKRRCKEQRRIRDLP